MKKKLLMWLFAIYATPFFAQEFFVRNANVFISDQVYVDTLVSKTPILHIRGSLQNDSGYITNRGEIQITGNITFTRNAILRDSGEWVFLGGKTAPSTIYNRLVQYIRGDGQSSFIGSNRFHSVIIDKPDWSTGNDSRIRIGKNVEIAKFLIWKQGGLITTDTVSHEDRGEDYSFHISLLNQSPAALSGYATAPGSTNRYIVGKFRRSVGIGEYFFPMGIEPDHTIGGMNAVRIVFTNTPMNGKVTAYLQKNNLQPLQNVITYTDIGTDPGSSGGNFLTCIGGPDGIIDKIILSKDQQYQWHIAADDSSELFYYSIEVMPTVGCESNALGDLIPSTCGSPYAGRMMTYLAHDGVPLGTPTTTINPAPVFSDVGFAVAPPVNYKIITHQVGFSNFRLHGAMINNTVLPVELITFEITPVDNRYFQLMWVTASEVNCKQFVLERSIDAVHFSPIATIPGNGTTTQFHRYHFDDYTVVSNIRYYYRLQQIDFDNTYRYSDIVSGKLEGNVTVAVFPNPSTGLITVSHDFDHGQLYNTLGERITIPAIGRTFNLSSLTHGVYIMKIFRNNNVYTFKVIKE